jgi:plasmid stability protein
MPNLSIKDVPESWAEALRQRAARHHRSLQGELMALLEQALTAGVGPTGSTIASDWTAGGAAAPQVIGHDARGWPIVRQGWKTPEQVIGELRQKYPQPVHDQPLAVDIVRHDRDSR